MDNKNLIKIGKHIIYSVLLLFLYVLQTTPGLFSIYGIKPILTITAAIAIAMYEDEVVGGIYGMAAGLLCDTGGNSLFGFNAMLMMSFCALIALLTIHLFQNTMINMLFFSVIVYFIRGSLEFVFSLGIWGYENVSRYYIHKTLPVMVYSLCLIPLFYPLVGKIHRSFKARSYKKI